MAHLSNHEGLATCPGCGHPVEGSTTGQTKTFCSNKCRTSFNNRMKSEGAPVAALMKAWAATRHAKPGTEEHAVCRYAMSEMTRIAQAFNRGDKDEERPAAVEYVKTLMASGTRWMDRSRKA